DYLQRTPTLVNVFLYLPDLHHQDLHSFPTRRSSDLLTAKAMKDQPQALPPPTTEHARLREGGEGVPPWRRWGPYVSERAWGTVREDYSADGDAWRHLPHDLAR